jgi:hypothetical protein
VDFSFSNRKRAADASFLSLRFEHGADNDVVAS